MAVSGRARYLSGTEAPQNTDFHTWMGKKHFLFLSNRRDREPNPELWRTLYIFYPFSAGAVFRRQILTSNDGPRTERVKR